MSWAQVLTPEELERVSAITHSPKWEVAIRQALLAGDEDTFMALTLADLVSSPAERKLLGFYFRDAQQRLRAAEAKAGRARGQEKGRRARAAAQAAEDALLRGRALAMKRRGGPASSDRSIAANLGIGRGRLARLLSP